MLCRLQTFLAFNWKQLIIKSIYRFLKLTPISQRSENRWEFKRLFMQIFIWILCQQKTKHLLHIEFKVLNVSSYLNQNLNQRKKCNEMQWKALDSRERNRINISFDNQCKQMLITRRHNWQKAIWRDLDQHRTAVLLVLVLVVLMVLVSVPTVHLCLRALGSGGARGWPMCCLTELAVLGHRGNTRGGAVVGIAMHSLALTMKVSERHMQWVDWAHITPEHTMRGQAPQQSAGKTSAFKQFLFHSLINNFYLIIRNRYNL